MAAFAKSSIFALRSLPPPEEWHKHKVALISGHFLSSRPAGRPTFVITPARMGDTCSCLDLARVTFIIGAYFVQQDRAYFLARLGKEMVDARGTKTRGVTNDAVAVHLTAPFPISRRALLCLAMSPFRTLIVREY